MRIITSEQVSAGHPDKICDQIADAIVTDCLQHDRSSRVAIECLFKNRCLVIAGELTSTHEPDYKALVQQVFDRINNGGAENSDAGLDYKLDFTADSIHMEKFFLVKFCIFPFRICLFLNRKTFSKCDLGVCFIMPNNIKVRLTAFIGVVGLKCYIYTFKFGV